MGITTCCCPVKSLDASARDAAAPAAKEDEELDDEADEDDDDDEELEAPGNAADESSNRLSLPDSTTCFVTVTLFTHGFANKTLNLDLLLLLVEALLLPETSPLLLLYFASNACKNGMTDASR